MVTPIILTGALMLSSQTPMHHVNVLTAPRFCEGIRMADEQTGWTYKDFLAEFALDLAAAAKIEEQEILDALKEGATHESAMIRGIAKRAHAKALMAVRHGERVKSGQTALCGKISNNW